MSTELPTPLNGLEAIAGMLDQYELEAAREGKPFEWEPSEVVRTAIEELTQLRAQLATAQEEQKRLREALTPWLDSYKTWMAEAREVGHSDFCVTAGMVVNTMNALRAMQSSPTLAREERIIK